MSDTSTTADAPGVSGRTAKAQILGFVSDADTEAALRVGLISAGPEELVIQRGGIRQAIAAMRKMASPRVLLVDISDDEQPMSSLAALSEVVEPDVRVLVIGDRQDLNLYRQLTRAMGVAEYLYKPVSAEVVALHFGPYVASTGGIAKQTFGGRVLAIMGVCGGAGASTIAANLGWYLANEVKRHTALLDANLHVGTVALLLGAKTGNGLRLALETPSRVDDVFIERVGEPAGERLAVIAAEEKLTDQLAIVRGAAGHLLEKLRQRYNYIIVDMPLAGAEWHNELLDMTRQRILVLQPTLASVRDALRAMALPMGPQQIRQPLIVLNSVGAPGTMTRNEVESALQSKVNVAIPYLPRVLNPAATLAVPAVSSRSGFRTAVRELAREVAAVGVVDNSPASLGRLFRRRAAR